jgi:hypothetical protein
MNDSRAVELLLENVGNGPRLALESINAWEN